MVATRRLNAEETSAWARVMASVRPIRPVRAVAPPPVKLPDVPTSVTGRPAVAKIKGRVPPIRQPEAAARTAPKPHAAATLDGSWDRRLTRGMRQPDMTLDLHGHTLASAHALLDQGLDRALARGARVILLVTGKPPRPESERPHARGAIRAAVADWLAASRFADRIAAVRGAHPRHGGAGALYIVLRRP